MTSWEKKVEHLPGAFEAYADHMDRVMAELTEAHPGENPVLLLRMAREKVHADRESAGKRRWDISRTVTAETRAELKKLRPIEFTASIENGEGGAYIFIRIDGKIVDKAHAAWKPLTTYQIRARRAVTRLVRNLVRKHLPEEGVRTELHDALIRLHGYTAETVPAQFGKPKLTKPEEGDGDG